MVFHGLFCRALLGGGLFMAAAAVAVFANAQRAGAVGAFEAPAAAWPPPAFLGRWTGEGRLGFREGKTESVKCRVTYFADGEPAATLKQNVRCATPGAAVEVKSEITESNGALRGVWTETVHNLSGEITGVRTAQGFRVRVKNAELDATMDLILMDATQVIEIQFHNSMLLGLSIALTKG